MADPVTLSAMSLKMAEWLGTFFGVALKQCAPVLVAIIREAMRDTAEVGKPNKELEDAWETGLGR